MSQILCDECGGGLVISEKGEYICEKCGLVYEDVKITSLTNPKIEFKEASKHFEIFNRTPFKVPIAWNKASDKNRVNEVRSLRHINKLDFIQRYYLDKISIKAVRKSYAVLLSLCSLIPLQFSGTVRRRALEIYYVTITRMRGVRKNHVALITASFYIALREICKNCDLTLRQLMVHLNGMGINTTLSDLFKAFFILRKATGVVLRPRKAEDLLSMAIRKLVNNENLRKKLAKNQVDASLYSKELYVKAASLLKRVCHHRSPLSLVATALYTADRILALKYRWKEVLTQRVLGSILKVSPFTIRELYYKAFRQYIFSDENEG